MDDAQRDRAIAELLGRIGALEEMIGLRSAPQPRPVAHREPRPSRDFSWLVGPRGFALAGGVVTILGFGFLFALAASRGWIGPAARCAFGAALSLLLLGAAVAVKRRFEHDVAARAAAGTGIAGLYLSLFAATRIYDLLPQEVAWLTVVAVACLAVAFALAWSSEVLASLGLVTAALAPPFIVDRLSAREVGAAAVAAAAALAIGQARSWRFVALATYTIGLIEALAFLFDVRQQRVYSGTSFETIWLHRWSGSAVAGVFFVLALLGAVAYQRRDASLLWLASLLAAGTVPLGLVAVHQLIGAASGGGVFRGNGQAAALAALAVVYALASWSCWRRPATRELGELVAALGLVAAGLATATSLSNASLVIAWSLEGLALAALAARTVRRRYYAPAGAYLLLALAHVLVFDEPLRRLFREHANPAQHVGSLLVVTAALGAVGVLLHRGPEPIAQARAAVTGVTGALGLYAASLLVLQVAGSFQRGQTLVSALWAIVALALVGLGLSRRVAAVRTAGVALLGIALAKLFLFDLSQLSSLARVASFLSVGLVLLAASFVVQRLARPVRSS